MIRNITLTLAAAAAVLTLTIGAPECSAQVSASSYSSGGTAISKASGRGNTRLSANARVQNGGYAKATMHGSGRNGGFATGSSNANSFGGTAVSRGRSHANGWGARSHAESEANAFYGVATSRSKAIANGRWANANSEAGADAFFNHAHGRSTAIDNRYQAAPVYGPSIQPNDFSTGFPSQQSFRNQW